MLPVSCNLPFKVFPTITLPTQTDGAAHEHVQRGQKELRAVNKPELPQREGDVLLCVVGDA